MKPSINDPLPRHPHQIAFTTAHIQTQSYCNARCIICPYVHVKHSFKQGKMTWDLFTKIIDDILHYPTLKCIMLTLQNEPLLDRGLPEKINYIRKQAPDMEVAITTNGSLLDNKTLKSLSAAGLTSIISSINALTKETFDRIEKGLNFDIVMKNLFHLINRKPKDLYVAVKMMLVKQNAIEILFLDRFSTLGKSIKKNDIPLIVGPISNRAGNLRRYRDLLIYSNEQSSKKKLYCHDIFESLNILFNGDVIACCADWTRCSVMGNINELSLKEIWADKKAYAQRVSILKGQYNKISPCKNCSQAFNIRENMPQRRKKPR